jgi:hypothetical protein
MRMPVIFSLFYFVFINFLEMPKPLAFQQGARLVSSGKLPYSNRKPNLVRLDTVETYVG